LGDWWDVGRFTHSLYFDIGLAAPESWIKYRRFGLFTWPQHPLRGSGMWFFDGLQ